MVVVLTVRVPVPPVSRRRTPRARTAGNLIVSISRALSLRTWARYLPAARDLGVVEFHLLRVIGAAAAAPGGHRFSAAAAAARQSSGRWRDETWATKLRRTHAAVTHPLAPQLEHTRRTELNGWKPE